MASNDIYDTSVWSDVLSDLNMNFPRLAFVDYDLCM